MAVDIFNMTGIESPNADIQLSQVESPRYHAMTMLTQESLEFQVIAQASLSDVASRRN